MIVGDETRNAFARDNSYRRTRSAMLDPHLLRTFLAIVEGSSFSETSRRLALRQSTVSDHVRRLERSVGHQLFLRDTHSVALTAEGEALIAFARSILETGERAERHFAGVKLRGRIRFGASEDLVGTWLPSVLAGFAEDHPDVDLEFTIALSSTLTKRINAGELDVVLCKRWPGETHGELVWRDEIVWIGADAERYEARRQVPLILYPPPSITRSLALAALGRTQIPWRISCTSDSLSGLVAAAEGGLGLTVLARNLIPPGLREIGAKSPLPPLGALDFVLIRKGKTPGAQIVELASLIRAKAQSSSRTRIG